MYTGKKGWVPETLLTGHFLVGEPKGYLRRCQMVQKRFKNARNTLCCLQPGNHLSTTFLELTLFTTVAIPAAS
jgi:hypothetical protein